MQYPLIDRQILSYLRLVHAFYNSSMMLLFFYHGWMGITIRRLRKAGGPLPFPVIRRHRKMGPPLTVLGVVGFFIGFTLVLVDTGRVLEYPPHLFAGLVIVVLLPATFAISRKIKGPDSPYRNPHFTLGVILLFLYVIEVFLGVGVLF